MDTLSFLTPGAVSAVARCLFCSLVPLPAHTHVVRPGYLKFWAPDLGCRRQNRFQPPVLFRTYILVVKSINVFYVLIYSSHPLQTHVTALLRPRRKQLDNLNTDVSL